MRKSPSHQAELGFQAYVQGNSTGTVLQPVNVYAASLPPTPPVDPVGNPEEFPSIILPALTFTGSGFIQLGYDSGLYEGKLTARLETQIDQDMTTAADVHGARIEALRDLLENASLIYTWFQTESPVPCFGVTALTFDPDGERLSNENRTLVAEFDYYLGCTVNPS